MAILIISTGKFFLSVGGTRIFLKSRRKRKKWSGIKPGFHSTTQKICLQSGRQPIHRLRLPLLRPNLPTPQRTQQNSVISWYRTGYLDRAGPPDKDVIAAGLSRQTAHHQFLSPDLSIVQHLQSPRENARLPHR